MVDFFRLYTHGNLDLSASQVLGWFVLPHARSEYTGSGTNDDGRQQLIDWAIAAAIAGGADLSNFFGIVVCMNSPTNIFGDLGSTAHGMRQQLDHAKSVRPGDAARLWCESRETGCPST
jgi:hypothetical protein